MNRKKIGAYLLSLLMSASCLCSLGGCGSAGGNEVSAGVGADASVNSVTGAAEAGAAETGAAEAEATETGAAEPDSSEAGDPSDGNAELLQKPDTENYIELALNVYYNDSDSNYYANESGDSIFVTEGGTYTLSFDCTKDLSNEAQKAGVRFLDNLTAVYLIDMGVAKKKQSPLTACNIFYDAVVVDGTPLTVTMTEPKSAFKSSGVFDTNDPINGWDGSKVEEVVADDSHAANFTTLSHPKTIEVTFTLSDLKWGAAESESEGGNSDAGSSETAGKTDGDGAGAGGTAAGGMVNTAVFSNIDFSKMDALTFTKYLGNGINLGNTMEAYGRGTFGTDAAVKSYETAWGQPVTTAEMVRGMKDCGFDTLRIPVAWTNMINYESGDYTINEAYLNRVEEIVNYALDAEMFVIINDHWDGGWWAMFGSKDAQSVQNAWNLYESMWQQICDRFKDYSDMLIFESANEELGDGLNDNTDWADSGALTENGRYEMTNAINQRFVDLVRKSGGNNANRFLLIAGYNTDINKTCDSRFEMPKDTADSKLLLSVHYYDPWNYCGDKSSMTKEKLASFRWGLAKEYTYMKSQLSKMNKFTKAGYGVIIGEYGALPAYIDNKSYALPNSTEYTDYLLSVCDLNNFCPILWSTGNSYDKTTKSMINEEMTALFQSRSFAVEEAAGDSYLPQVEAKMESAAADAPEAWEGQETYEAGTPVAWIMWNGGAGTYSVGDTFNAADNTAGIKASNVVIDGAGAYEVSLDFAEGNDGLTFAALGIADGELLYPNMFISIESITCDGKEIDLTAVPYTCSDDGKCTRVNLYNSWVTTVPNDARCLGKKALASAMIIDKTDMVGIKNITVKFRVIIMGQAK